LTIVVAITGSGFHEMTPSEATKPRIMELHGLESAR
jgi:hypothetical protein